jgi:uncharacterized protein YdhG (YjbR/CyaY superfamily)
MISDEAEEKRTEIYRSMSPEHKLRISLELYEFARAVVEASIKKYHPDITPEELKMELIKRFHGDIIYVAPKKGKTGKRHRIRD